MRHLIIVLSALLLSSCASYRPIIDQQSVYSQDEYEMDLAECQSYANQMSPGKAAVLGAGIGAGIGAVAGLVVGSILHVKPGRLAGLGAALGGMQGAAKAGADSGMSQVEIIRECMRGRGYRVLK